MMSWSRNLCRILLVVSVTGDSVTGDKVTIKKVPKSFGDLIGRARSAGAWPFVIASHGHVFCNASLDEK